MKFIFSLIFIILFLGFVSSSTLNLSPTEIEFIGDPGEKICKKMLVETDTFQTLKGSVRWAGKGIIKRDLLVHDFSSEDLDLEIEFPVNLSVEKKKEIEICITANEGKYHGVLLYHVENSNLQMGVWLNLQIGEEIEIFQKNISFGKEKKFSLNSGSKKISEFPYLEIELGFGILLVIILFLIILKERKFKTEFSK